MHTVSSCPWRASPSIEVCHGITTSFTGKVAELSLYLPVAIQKGSGKSNQNGECVRFRFLFKLALACSLDQECLFPHRTR